MEASGLGAAVYAAPGLSAGAGASQIVNFSALELSAAIHAREVSCAEVMGAHLDQIERLNPTFNAIVSLAERADLMREAQLADQALDRGQSRGWMHGFPIAIKDLAHAEGFVTSMGSPIFAGSVAKQDSVHVARMKAAGGIVIGKTNVPEFGLGSQSYNGVFGATRSAYDRTKTAGGSSGGAAAALALRMVPVADGSDFMGSLRNPGAFNNVIGFRPTPGIVPLGNDFKEALACNGPMARNVSDAARLLSTMAGPTAASPGSLPVDATQYAQPLEREWKGLRVGWLGDFGGYLPFEPGVLETCRAAMQGFAAIGMEVKEVQPDFDMPRLWQTWLVYRHWMNRARGLAMYNDPDMRPHLKPEFVWEVEGGAAISGDDLNNAMAARAAWYQSLLALYEDVDALVWPTTQVFPFDAATHWPKTVGDRKMDTYHRWMETVIPGTLAGGPVLNVPAGFGENGLPVGLQVMTPRYTDFRALQLGYAYEQATRWNLDHLPPPLKGAA